MSTLTRRLGALAGIGAPASFITGWVVGGLRAKDYDPLRDAISQLARVDAPTRPLMTAGFLGFSVLAPFWAKTVSESLGEPRVRTAIHTATVGTLAVAALPLGASFGDGPHAAAAGVSYLAMVATPALGAQGLTGGARTASYAVSAVGAVALVASLLGKYDGGFQRLGLTSVDAWYVAMAVRELRR